MIEDETVVTLTKGELDKLNLKIAESRRSWWKKPSYLAALLPAILVSIVIVYGFASGFFQASFVRKETVELQSEAAEILKQNDLLEQKRAKILEKLKKTGMLLEQSKNSSAQVDAHIEVLSSSCISCPPPAWMESYKTTIATLGEIEKVLNEDNDE